MLSGLLLEDAVLYNATRKINNPPDKILFMGVLAGIWVGIGGLAGISAAGGVPSSVRLDWLLLPKFLLGAFFAFGKILIYNTTVHANSRSSALHFITMFGGDLFTGNTMVLAIGKPY